MNEEQVMVLITSALAAAKTEIMSDVTKANQGLAANISKEIKRLATSQSSKEETEGSESSEGKLTLKALQQQIADLTNQLQEKDKQAFEADKTSAIASVIAASGTQNKSTLQKLFALQYGAALKKEGNSWFVEQEGTVKPLNAVFKSYLESEEGSIFLPASSVDGSGSKETKTTTTPTTTTPSNSLGDSLGAITNLFASGQL